MDFAAALTASTAEEVRSLMARRKLRQVDLAAAIGRSQSYVSRALAGSRPFDVADLIGLAGLLEVSPAQLLGPLRDTDPATFS